MDHDGEARRVPPIIIIFAVFLALAGLAYIGYRASVSQTVEALYGLILTTPPLRLEKFPTEADRLKRAQMLLGTWHALDSPTLDLTKLQVMLPFPLRITRTFVVSNNDDLRKRAGEVFARDLATLSGRKATSATLAAWDSEIAAWKSGISAPER